jgi:hypothetical protein
MAGSARGSVAVDAACDRLKQLSPMADRGDAKSDQIVGGELR